MFLTCEGIAPGSTADSNGPRNFHAGYQRIEGINLGYLQIDGTRMFALAQVLSDLFKDIPRATISKKMEILKIKSRRCDLAELRTLKAINSVPTRAVKCSLISKADLEALCTSCKSLSPGRRKRRRKSRRREQLLFQGSGEIFPCSRPPPCCGSSSGRVLPSSGPQQLQPARGGFFGAVVTGSPRDLELLLHPSAAQPCALPAALAPAGRYRRAPSWCKGLVPPAAGPAAARKGRSCSFPASKRQGTSAGYSSDSDSSLDLAASSPATSSDSSEEEEDEEEEEGDSSCSSEEGSSSESESSSLCSGDSVQSTRYRQAALPRFQPPREAPGEERPAEPPPGKAPRPEPELLFLSQHLWARTLRASTLETLSSAAQPGLYARHEASPASSSSSSSSSSSPPPSPSSTPGGAPPQKERGTGDAGGKDLHKDASNKSGSSSSERPGGASPAAAPSSEPSPELRGSPGPAGPGEPRPEHFDRLIRRSKLWCYAKGFNVDGKTLRHGAESADPWRGTELRFQPRRSTAQNPGAIRGARQDGTPKRRRLSRASERQQRNSSKTPPKTPRRNCRKGNAPCKAGPARNSFSLMGNFPCTPSLVVGEDGDLCPASSLGGKNSWALSKTHPLWRWHLGGSAIPVPPSLKFRGCGILEDP